MFKKLYGTMKPFLTTKRISSAALMTASGIFIAQQIRYAREDLRYGIPLPLDE